MNQLIEHVGQREYWGNMLDVLPSLLDISKYHSIAQKLQDQSIITTARARLLKAQPIPGFMIGKDEYEDVAPLIDAIFSQEFEGKTVEDLLNGK